MLLQFVREQISTPRETEVEDEGLDNHSALKVKSSMHAGAVRQSHSLNGSFYLLMQVALTHILFKYSRHMESLK